MEQIALPCGHVLRSPLVKAPLFEAMADKHGVPTERYVRLYSRFAENADISLLVTGNIMVTPKGNNFPGTVCLTSQDNVGMTSQTVRCLYTTALNVSAHCHQLRLIGELNHGGRTVPKNLYRSNFAGNQSGLYHKKVIACTKRRPTENLVSYARPLSILEELRSYGLCDTPILDEVIADFANAAHCLVMRCAFNGVHINAAGEYLLGDILRNDGWSVLRTLLRSVRQAIGRFSILGLKISFPQIDILRFLGNLATLVCDPHISIDILDISTLDYIAQSDETYPREVGTVLREILAHKGSICRLMVTGGFRSKLQAEIFRNETGVSLVGFGRPFCLPEPFGENTALIVAQDLPMTRGERAMVKALKPLIPHLSLPLSTLYWVQCLHALADGTVRTNLEVSKILRPKKILAWYMSWCYRRSPS
ncbi:FAD/FMN dependent oxidoreductase [Giardia muris]|uniref:FAD/FMN dependent oxidoreductase n=1 Tax=Giardia muris TaxID=5742 RepID=A0A3S7RND2_GIAMU|nr:NADH oxidase (FAD/FMN dependent oxidoreductase) [Giardia muris]TNJ30608.1 FAD/FMN dependent oxidoreductase [Giardia muris]|eukprot:TNJ30608.1 FAD/FMN dependent oxidoreductase [Giardia muris]